MSPGLVTISVLSGGFVGLTLGVGGGAGAIMATPLLLYAVGLAPHQAIGTGAVAVAGSAVFALVRHVRAGSVRWRPAGLFALIGMIGVAIGAQVGKMVDGDRLLALYALLMLLVGVRLLRRRTAPAVGDGAIGPRRAGPGFVAAALGIGLLSGLFGIGGGFLIVPALLLTTGMTMPFAVGSALLGVGGFGITTAATYALSGLIDWKVASTFLEGWVIGAWLGGRLQGGIGRNEALLSRVLGAVACATACVLLYRTTLAMGWL